MRLEVGRGKKKSQSIAGNSASTVAAGPNLKAARMTDENLKSNKQANKLSMRQFVWEQRSRR